MSGRLDILTIVSGTNESPTIKIMVCRTNIDGPSRTIGCGKTNVIVSLTNENQFEPVSDH